MPFEALAKKGIHGSTTIDRRATNGRPFLKMHYAYILVSEKHEKRQYIGYSQDLRTRVSDHNKGKNVSTRSGRPWRLVFYAGFESETEARGFEAYLKTASGKAFARKRLLPGSP